MLFERSLSIFTMKNSIYRVTHLLANLGWVDFDLGCSKAAWAGWALSLIFSKIWQMNVPDFVPYFSDIFLANAINSLKHTVVPNSLLYEPFERIFVKLFVP